MAFAAVRSSRLFRPTMAGQIPGTRQISFSSYLVTPKELNEALKKNPPTRISTSPRVIPLCAAWFLPDDKAGRTGIETFRKLRIPKARFFDIDKVTDRHSPYPHMLPSEKDFASAMSEPRMPSLLVTVS